MVSLGLAEMIAREENRRGRRNTRDRLAREFLRLHPDIKDDPDLEFNLSDIPEGTTESAVRAIARFYQKQSLVRSILKEKKNDDTGRGSTQETQESFAEGDLST